jgi:riboflavin biosynthesis pyrimidine reductase/LPS sulfotransferase NodH
VTCADAIRLEMERPLIHINFALNAQGSLNNGPATISCATDWRRVHELRESYDAVAVGGKTWNADRPQLNVRREHLGRDPNHQPVRVIFAGTHCCSLLSNGHHTYVISAAPVESGIADWIPCCGHSLEIPLKKLYQRGVRSMLVEGGATLIRSFLKQGMADQITIFVRTGCLEAAERAARGAIGELPPRMIGHRLGEGVLLTAPQDPARPAEAFSPRRFVIFATPRSGSNMLCTMLNSHPDILCHHEVFNPEAVHYALDHRNGEINLGSIADRENNPESFIDSLWRHHCKKSAVGFKLNRGQNDVAFRHVLEDQEVRKILLTRRNRVQAYVSELIAQQTGGWESYAFSGFQSSGRPVTVDVARLLEHAANNQRYMSGIQAKLYSTGQRFLQTAYEDLGCADEQRRILEFLNLAPTTPQLRPATRKLNSANLRELVSNFDELEQALRGTEFEPELRPFSAAPEIPYLWSVSHD